MKRISRKILICFLIVLFVFPLFIRADSVEDTEDFFVDSGYDRNDREELSASLILESDLAYFYIEEEWWNKLGFSRQEEIENSLEELSLAFGEEIYPTLTSNFGSEWKPGIDEDDKITVLFHWMKEGRAGYFREADEYPLLQSPYSNEREMVYLNTDYITNDLIDSYLAHEFTHLITFNQKKKERGIFEEVWLNEARAEFSPTLVGYDSEYTGSNLERRVSLFLKNPSDSITEWKGKSDDYGVLNIFTQYLVDRYGKDVLIDSLQSGEFGIASIDLALEKNGFDKNFSQVFQDWTLAVLLNDCFFGEEYCYSSSNLKNLRVGPTLNFFPFASRASLKIEDYIKDWSGSWYKLMGGKGDLEIDFKGIEGVDYRVFYVLNSNSNEYSINKLQLNNSGSGAIEVDDFGEDYKSITLVISTGEKKEGFGRSEIAYPFSFEAVTIEKENGEEEVVQEFLTQINHLEVEIEELEEEVSKVEEAEEETIRELLARSENLDLELNRILEEVQSNEEMGEEINQEFSNRLNDLKIELNVIEEEINNLEKEEKEDPGEKEEIPLITILANMMNDSRIDVIREFLGEQRIVFYIFFKYFFI